MKWIYFTLTVFSVSIVWLLLEINWLDSRYSRLIEDGALQHRLIQRLTFNSNQKHILLFFFFYSNDTTERKLLISKMSKLGELNTRIYDSLLKINSVYPEQVTAISNVIASRKTYNTKEQEYLQLITTSAQPFADFNKAEKLDAAFFNYQKEVNELFVKKNSQVLLISDQFTSATEKKLLFILTFSVLPIGLLALVIFLLVYLIRQIFFSYPKEAQ